VTHTNTTDQRPSWRSPGAAGLMAFSLAIVALAQRDIHHRTSNEVRGSKLLWRLVSLNALGAIAYFKWGRSAAAADA
jgi:hypothetical protein